MTNKGPDDFEVQKTDGDGCAVCRELLASLGRFFEMLDGARKSSHPEWLTVEEVARELKISKSIVYRLIRNGELDAVNIVEASGRMPKKGHYRVQRTDLDKYLEAKRMTRPPNVPLPSRCKHYPNVKNHLGL